MVVAAMAVMFVAAAPEQGTQKKIDPKADKLLHEMSDRLSALPRFQIVTHNVLEAVTKDGRKLQFDSDSKTDVERPNKLLSQRLGELAKLRFYYDGKSFTLYEQSRNYYATAPAPANLDAAVDAALEGLDIEAPLADLIVSDPYKALMEDVTRGDYVSESTIEGSPCHHLAYEGTDTDWQIWIDAQTKLPRKYLIISKNVQSWPEFSVVVRSWNLEPPPVDFTFRPPPGAARINFAPRGTNRS
jgi:hypothetical protein